MRTPVPPGGEGGSIPQLVGNLAQQVRLPALVRQVWVGGRLGHRQSSLSPVLGPPGPVYPGTGRHAVNSSGAGLGVMDRSAAWTNW